MQRIFAIVIYSLLCLTACGYQLRGSLEMPEALKNVYLSGTVTALQAEMTSFLKSSNARMSPMASDAGIVIKILREDMKNRVVSLGTTGKSTESEINYYLRYQFFDNKDNPMADEQIMELSREFFNDQTAVLAKASEEQLIRSELYKQAARLLLARARIVVDNQKK